MWLQEKAWITDQKSRQLQASRFFPVHVQELAVMLEKNKSITDLNLKSNFGDQGAKAHALLSKTAYEAICP